MDQHLVKLVLNLLTFVSLIGGLFFMTVGVVGLWRMPDLYNRIHAATKGVTLGISGLLLASAFSLTTLEQATPINIITKIALVILFQFVANPVGAHLLAKAAHMDRCPTWTGTLMDELEEDTTS